MTMNFFSNFSEQWNSRFPDTAQPPQLDCLKADHFCTLLDQKHALELEESKICAVLEDLKNQLARESFIAEFLHKCIQKLGAVSQVFNEIDQCDSKSSSSSGTTGRNPGSLSSPGLSINGSGMTSQCKGSVSTSASHFPLFPQCITSSLMHSASPLFAAAAATSTPFLLPSTFSHFPCPESIKLDPESESLTGLSSNFLLSAADRPTYGNLSRLTSQSSFYNSNNTTINPFHSNSNSFTHSVNSSLRPHTPLNETTSSGRASDVPCRLSEGSPTSEAQVAAAAVAAAFGLGLSSVRPIGPSQPFTQTCHTSGFGKADNSLPTSTVHGTRSSAEHSITTTTHSNVTSAPTGLNDSVDLMDPNSSERPYRCGTCSRSFAVKAGLVQHMRTHTDERPYPCLHCGRAFKQKIQLTTHMRVHSGERPYGCRLCGKLFRQQSHVVQHLRTHTGEKPHKCYQCGKAFRQKYSLISHQRRMCRNRAASNPIAAGMTMWISPGVGGDTCNLVKEFSPTKCHLAPAVSSNTSPGSVATLSVTNTTSMHSPFPPFLSSPSMCVTTTAAITTQSSKLSVHKQFHSSPSHHQPPSSHPDDAHLTSIQGRSRHPAAYRHRGDHVEPGPDLHPTQLCSDQEAEEVDEQICSPRTSRINTPTALGLS